MKIFLQEDIKDCGLCVIKSFVKHYYCLNLDINILKKKAHYTNNGINASELINLANYCGLNFEAFETDVNNLFNSKINGYFVALIKNQNYYHYVIAKLKRKSIIIYDSQLGYKKRRSIDEFSKIFCNVIFIVKTNKKKINLKTKSNTVWDVLINNWWLIFLNLAIMVLTLIFQILSTFNIKIIIDWIYPYRLEKSLLNITFIFIGFALFIFVLTWLKNWIFYRWGVYLENKFYNKYFDYIKSFDFFKQNTFTTPDLLKRLSIIKMISSYVSSFHLMVSYNLILISSILLLILNINLYFFLFLVSIGLFLAFYFLCTHKLLIDYENDYIKTSQKLLIAQYDFINARNEFNNFETKNYYYQKKHSQYLNSIKKEKAIWKLTNNKNLVYEFFNLILPILVTYFGFLFVFQNKFQIGQIFFVFTILNYYQSSFKELIVFILKIPSYKKNIELFNFFFLLDQTIDRKEKQSIDKLHSISFNCTAIGYSHQLYRINNFTISSSIVIEGKSGIGKSTFLNVLAGKFLSQENFYINNIHWPLIDQEKYSNYVLHINQNNYLPNETILDYITFKKEEYLEEFLNNCQKFNLLILLEKVNLNLSASIVDNGRNFSSGQRQLIFLLKLFAKQYHLVLLDEAADSLDELTYKTLTKAICNYQNNAIFIEISHNKKYIKQGEIINFENIITT